MIAAILPYVLSSLLGALFGLGELLSRHRDSPFSAVSNPNAIAYIAINALVSALVLYLIQELGLVTFADQPEKARTIYQVLAAGIGGIAILRVGFSVSVSGEKLSLSFAALTDPLLQATNDAVDRAQARNKLEVIQSMVADLECELAVRELPPICLSLMRNVSKDDADQLGELVSTVVLQNVAEQTKLLNVMSALLDIVGESVLQEAVNSLKSRPIA